MCGKPPTHGFRTLSHSDRVCRAGLAAWRAFLSTILRAVGNHLISDAAAAQAVWVEDAIFGRLPPSWGSHVLGLSAYATEIGRSLVPAYSGTGSGVAGAIVASGYADMLGQSVGTGQCVALAQATSDVGYTSTWSPGAQVEGDTDIAVGTAIATFGSDGTYTNTYGQSHTAIYLGQDSSGIFVEDQWLGQPAQTRHINWTTTNSYESGSQFHVVTHS